MPLSAAEYQMTRFIESSQLTAGNTSPVFTTSGMSSEDINALGERYGYVTKGPRFEFFNGGLGVNLSL